MAPSEDPRAVRTAWLVVGAIVAAQLWLLGRGLTVDDDALREAANLVNIPTLRAAFIARGRDSVLYAAETPLLWLTSQAGRAVSPRWNELDATRLLAALALIGLAVLLVREAARRGAAPLGLVLAGVFPFCWHGFTFMAAGADDNVVTDVFRVGYVIALLRYVGLEAPRLRDRLLAGAWWGAALAWHWQSVLLGGATLLALPLGREPGRRLTAFREAVTITAAGFALYLGWVAAAYACGLGLTFPVTRLGSAWLAYHQGGSVYWWPGSGRSLGEQAALWWTGWGRMILGVEWLRPAGPRWSVAVTATLLHVAFAGWLSFLALGRGRERAVWAAVLGLQAGHALLYEPESVERWDLPAVLLGLLAVSAVRAPQVRIPRPLLRAVWAALAAVLFAYNLSGWRAYGFLAEEAFQEAAAGAPAPLPVRVQCVGAQYRLGRAAEAIAAAAGGAPVAVADSGAADPAIRAWLPVWLGYHLAIRRVPLAPRAVPGGLEVWMLRQPPVRAIVLAREGWVALVREPGPTPALRTPSAETRTRATAR